MAGRTGARAASKGSFFAPATVRLNTDTSLLKLIAMASMLCDHCGKMFFTKYPVMRLIGRMAFPIYAYCIAVGCIFTHDTLKYLRRVVLLALISQPIYAVAMAHKTAAMYSIKFAEHPVRAVLNFYINSWTGHPSVLVSLSVGIICIWTIRNRQFVLTAAMAVLVYLIRNKLDYGWKGIVLMVLFYLFCERWYVSLPLVLAFMLWWAWDGGNTYQIFGQGFSSQLFAIMSLPLIYIPTHTNIRLNKYIFYAFYPAHLLGILAMLIYLGRA